MDGEPLILKYPLYLIGQLPADASEAYPGLQAWAVTDTKRHPALMLFTGSHLAERLIRLTPIPGHAISVDSPAILADIIRRNRKNFSLIMVDPDPVTRVGRGYQVDEFLRDLEK